jgi:hypothetical protein
MSLIIENGTIVPNANSIATAAEMKTYADLRGLAIPSVESEQESLLILAMDYLKTLEKRMKGTRTDVDQTLPEPRQNVWLFGQTVGANTIPIQYKNAQIEAAIAANTVTLLTNDSIEDIKREKLDVLETEFFEGGGWAVARLDRVDAAIEPLMASGGGFGRTVRVL